MNKTFYQLFGIEVDFFKGIRFAIPLALVNAFIIITFLELKEFEGYNS